MLLYLQRVFLLLHLNLLGLDVLLQSILHDTRHVKNNLQQIPVITLVHSCTADMGGHARDSIDRGRLDVPMGARVKQRVNQRDDGITQLSCISE